MKQEHIDEINKKVGQVIKARRLELGLSQEELGPEIGVTFQQLQKYESGINSLSLPRAIVLCRNLKIGLGQLWPEAISKVSPQFATLAKNFNKLTEGEQASVMALVRSLLKK